MKKALAALAAFFIFSVSASAAVSLEEMRQSQLYDHNKKWLKTFPSAFVAANIRGEDMQYAERRLAALDLVRQQRDFGVVSELTLALEKGSFMDVEVIDILDDWKAKRALPLLNTISKDPKRDAAVRERAAKAVVSIKDFKPAPPPKF